MENSLQVSDYIHVEQLEIFGRVGVTDEERTKPQRMELSMTLWPRGRFEAFEDNIERTVNYSAFCDAARDFVRDQACALIETLATKLAGHLLQHFPIDKIYLEVRKFVVPDTQYVSVALTRTRSDLR